LNQNKTPLALDIIRAPTASSPDHASGAGLKLQGSSRQKSVLVEGLSRAIIQCCGDASNSFLLGNVNFLFLVHVAQEQHESAGTEHDGQTKGNPAIYVPSPRIGVSDESIKLVNRAPQRGQTYN
jgi:hypothetical protein